MSVSVDISRDRESEEGGWVGGFGGEHSRCVELFWLLPDVTCFPSEIENSCSLYR